MPSTRRAALVALLSAPVLLAGTTPAAARQVLPASPGSAPLVEQVADATGARLVVEVRDAAQLAAVGELARSRGATVRHALRAIETMSLVVPRSRKQELTGALRRAPGVTSVRTAVRREVAFVPDDPSYAAAATYLDAVRAGAAWDLTKGDAGVRIAVVDSGVDVGHPDLAGKVVGRYNAVDGGQDVTDALGHGTLVAGVAAAASDNGVGVTGVGFDSSLLAVKVADADGQIFTDDEAAGIVWAADHGARVINLSLGSQETDAAESSAVAYARSKGALVVASAGNDGGTPLATAPTYPAALPGVLAVGATDPATGTRAGFSSHGPWVSVGAPGVGIASTAPTAGSATATPGYDSADGTSFAAPIVAGQAALLAAAFPTATAVDLRAAVVASAHGYADAGLGAGQVDLRGSLDQLTPLTRPVPTGPLPAAVVAGTVPLSATSTAVRVQFTVDGARVGDPVPVVAGAASATWTSFGAAQGPHQVRAADCNARGCGAPSEPVAVTVDNAAPSISSPATGQVVAGDVVVTVAVGDGAPAVRLSVDGRPAGPPVPVLEGAASLRWSSAGTANGAHLLKVSTCGPSGSCAAPAGVGVTLVNAAPALARPTGGRLVTGPTTITATGPAGGKLFRRGTAVLGFDPGAPWSVTTDFSTVPDGVHGLTVQSCGATAATCAGPVSAVARVTNRSVRPRLAAPGPALLSPDGDGRHDASVLRASLDQPMGLVWHVTDASGAVVRGPHSLGQRPRGPVSFTWDGRGQRGARLPDGRYGLVLSASRTVAGSVLRGTARAALLIDTRAPGLAVTPVSGGLYPHPDGYRDRVAPLVRVDEAGTATLTVRRADGAVVRTIALPRAAGTSALSWSGADARGRVVPAGSYRYDVAVRDASGNRRVSPSYALGVSRARLVGERVTRTVTPAATTASVATGACSAVADNGWPGGYDLLSGYFAAACRDYGDDVAATFHQLVLPPAVRYSPLTLSVTGQRALVGDDDTASAFYRAPDGDLVDEVELPAAYGTRALRTVPVTYLAGGRTLRWAVTTASGKWWSVRSFTVAYTAYSLR